MLTVYFGARPRTAFTLASLAVLWYWLLPLPFSFFVDDATAYSDPLFELSKLFGLEPEEMVIGDIEMFFISGIAMTSAATLFVVFNADHLLDARQRNDDAGAGRHHAGDGRMAISYPLASKFRTGMTLAMFTLVVFSLVVMATLNSNFTQLFLGVRTPRAASTCGSWPTPRTAFRTWPRRCVRRDTTSTQTSRVSGR